MREEPPTPASAGASIGDHTRIVGSTVNLTTNVTHQAPPWQPRWEPSAAEAQLLLDAMPTDRVPEISALPSGSRIPFAPNPHFVGRDAVLLALATALHGGARVAIGPKAAATGLGGIGKTSVAAEFVHRFGSYFAGGVFWLSFADPAAIPSEVAACGGPGLLDLHPTYGELKQDEQLALVRQAWQQPIPRLLVFDNAEDPQLVQQWAPVSGGCRVLITSRRQSWPSSLGVTAHSLDVLARAASVALLRDLAPHLTPEEADELAEELGDFPLALQLAGSYLAQYGRISVASYLAELRSDVILAHPSLRGLHDGDVSTTAHDRHVGRTFLVSYQRLDPARDALALALLARAACLAPGAPIPDGLLLVSADVEDEDARGHLALGRLADLGLMTVTDQGMVVHRLIHAFVGAVVQDATALSAVAVALIRQATAITQAGVLVAMAPLVPHLAWATQAPMQDVSALAVLCGLLGQYWQAIGAAGAAQPLLERALAITEAALGPNHPITGRALNTLAGLYAATRDYLAARPLLERALAIHEQALGPRHPDTAGSLNNLAALHKAMGAYGAAQPLYARALAITQAAVGDRHPATALCLNNLAGLHRAMGDEHAARPLLEQALVITEAAWGVDHSATAMSLNNLAAVYAATGSPIEARALFVRALVIQEATLGPDHPTTAGSRWWLGRLAMQAGDRPAATELLQHALASLRATLGMAHPLTQEVQQQLGMLQSGTDTTPSDTL